MDVRGSVEELADEYGLSAEDARLEVYLAITQCISREFGALIVNVDYDDFSITVSSPADKAGRSIGIAELGSGMVDSIRSKIKFNLEKRVVLNRHAIFRGLCHKAVEGTVSSVLESGGLLVEVVEAGEHVTAECAMHDIPEKERWKYQPGDRAFFYVTKVFPAIGAHGMPRLEVGLSRRSPVLTALLIQKFSGLSVKCTKRIAGAFSIVVTGHKIPKNSLAEVSRQLDEKIVVKPLHEVRLEGTA